MNANCPVGREAVEGAGVFHAAALGEDSGVEEKDSGAEAKDNGAGDKAPWAAKTAE